MTPSLKISKELEMYQQFLSLSIEVKCEIFEAVKKEHGQIKSITKLSRACFAYYIKNIHTK